MKLSTILISSGLVVMGAAGALGVSALAGSVPVGSAATDAPSHARANPSTFTPVAYVAESATAKSYQVDGVHSGVVFRIMHAGAAPFHGMFPTLAGTMTVDPQNPQATTIDVSIDTTKIATGNNSRDDHLRSADFFNARQFPTSTFKATGAKAAGDGSMTVEGQLTLLGKTLPVSATITPTGEGEFRGSKRAGFEAKLSFKRSDFGMTMYVEEGVLGDQVDLTVFIEGIEQ